MKKRICIIALCFCLAATMMPTFVFAEESAEPEPAQTVQTQEEESAVPEAAKAEEESVEGEEAQAPGETPAPPAEEETSAEEEEAQIPVEESGTVSQISSPAKAASYYNIYFSVPSVKLSVSRTSCTITVHGMSGSEAEDCVTILNSSIADFEIEYSNYYDYYYGDSFEVTFTRESAGTTYFRVYESEDAYLYGGLYKQIPIVCERTPLKLNKNKITFGTKCPYDSYSVSNSYYGTEVRFKSAVSSKKKVATAKVTNYYSSYSGGYNSYVTIIPKKKGKTTITVTDNYGRKQKIKVVVGKSWAKANLKSRSYCYIYYGYKKARLYGKKGSVATIRIGGRTIKKKIGKSGFAEANLGKTFKLNTNYSVTYRYKKTTYTQKLKVLSRTSAYTDTMYSCEYTIPVTVYNATKGDTVILRVGGRSYRKKINYTSERVTITFRRSEVNRYIKDLDLIVNNKYGQRLYKRHENIYWS